MAEGAGAVVAVVGAGVIGLSAARAIAQEAGVRRVHLLAKGFGSDTCSSGAGGEASDTRSGCRGRRGMVSRAGESGACGWRDLEYEPGESEGG